MILIDGKKVATEIKENIAKETEKIKNQGIIPGLAVILVGQNSASQIYVNSKEKACKQLGFYSEKKVFPDDISEEILLSEIDRLNNDDKVHGILVQLPLPSHISEDNVLLSIKPEKDVDGFHPMNVGKLVTGQDTLYPCTPYGILKLLEYYKIQTDGKHVVVLGRSNIVGKPVGMLLLQKGKFGNATVTYCHSRTQNLKEITRQADILVAAIGKPEFVTQDFIKKEAIVIDVGINRIPDDTREKGYKIVGDVNFEDVKEKVSYITPVPGGVGAMTIAMLMYNVLKAAKTQLS